MTNVGVPRFGGKGTKNVIVAVLDDCNDGAGKVSGSDKHCVKAKAVCCCAIQELPFVGDPPTRRQSSMKLIIRIYDKFSHKVPLR